MAGFCAYVARSFVEARSYYRKALQFDPNNLANIRELAMAQLSMDPIDVTGFWYAARARNLGMAQGWVRR